ncbi:MAG: hypothetical protein AAFP07_03055, partial [Cyanobacteria bacterium J06606_4]
TDSNLTIIGRARTLNLSTEHLVDGQLACFSQRDRTPSSSPFLTPHKTKPTAIPEKALKIPWAPSSHPIHKRSATP